MLKAFLIFPLLLSSLLAYTQATDEDLLMAIRNNEVSIVRNFFSKPNDPDRLYGQKGISLIHLAASLDNVEMLDILIHSGANIDKLYYDDTPSMVAAYYGKEKALKFLAKNGANINFQNKTGKTAAIYCAEYNQPGIIEILYKNGADLNIQDCTKKAAIDYAFKLQNIKTYKFLADIAGNQYDTINMPDYFDGPYMFWQDKSTIKISYLISDSRSNKCYLVDSTIETTRGKILLYRPGQEFEIPVYLPKKKQKPLDKYNGVKKIMAIGDLHGGFEEFRDFLIKNKIIDSQYKWTFGDGHLLLLGDIFDRGSQVTECIWLLYKLESEAELQGGKVHFVLGNHEIMEFSEDKRYLNDKYLNLFNRLRLNYSDFYGPDTELGKWLRSKNAVVQINDILFVHGGISPELLQTKLSKSAINKMIREVINRQPPEPKGELEHFLFGNNGPLWYRGYLKLDDKYYKSTGEKYNITEKKLDEILKYFKVKTIVFANTNVQEIKPLFHNKIFGIDIPFAEKNIHLQGLFIDNEGFFRAYDDGRKEQLK